MKIVFKISNTTVILKYMSNIQKFNTLKKETTYYQMYKFIWKEGNSLIISICKLVFGPCHIFVVISANIKPRIF